MGRVVIDGKIRNIVDNVYQENGLPLLNHATTDVAVMRNTDNEWFYPTTIILTNRTTDTDLRAIFHDEDATDAEGDTDHSDVHFECWVGAKQTVVLNHEDLKAMNLRFRYGVTGILSATNATGVSVYMAGYFEHEGK